MATNTAHFYGENDIPILTFSLGDQLYALPIADVIEVASMVELVQVASPDPTLLGMANRHGKPLPMIDLRQIMTPQATSFEVDSTTLFVVVRHQEQLYALVVGEIHQVEYVPSDWLDTSTATANYIRGIIGQRERLIQVVDLDTVLSPYLSMDSTWSKADF